MALLRRDDAVETRAEHREGQRRRQDPDGGRGDEGGEPDAEQRGRQIDQPERKRHEPQEQQVAEGIGAEAFRKLRRERSGAPRQPFAAGASRDQEDHGGAGQRADERRDGSDDGPEQETAGHGHDRAARQGKADHGDIERHISGDRGDAVIGDELIDCGAIADQCLERDVAVQAEPIGQRDEGPDDEKRARTADTPGGMARGPGRLPWPSPWPAAGAGIRRSSAGVFTEDTRDKSYDTLTRQPAAARCIDEAHIHEPGAAEPYA